MSGKVLAATRKRRKYPIVVEGETFYVRMMTCGEEDNADGLDKGSSERVYYSIGCMLVTDAGEPVYQRAEGEPLKDFAERVRLAEADLPIDTLMDILSKSAELQKFNMEKLSKN